MSHQDTLQKLSLLLCSEYMSDHSVRWRRTRNVDLALALWRFLRVRRRIAG